MRALHSVLGVLLVFTVVACGDDEPAGALDAGSDAAGDAAPSDGAMLDMAGSSPDRMSLHGWSPETANADIQLHLGGGGFHPDHLVADPVTPGRLFISRSPSIATQAWGVTWSSGSFGATLYGTSGSAMPAPISWEWRELDGAGNVYVQVCCWVDDPLFAPAQKRRLAWGDGAGAWSWSALEAPAGAIAGITSSWPPTKFTIAPGANPRVLVGNESGQLWDIGGHVGQPASYARYDVDTSTAPADLGLVKLLSRDRLISVTGSTVVRLCDIVGSGVVCGAADPRGVVPGDVPSQVSVAGGRILLRTLRDTAPVFYLSSDGGESFTALSPPSSPVGYSHSALSPVGGKIALVSTASSSIEQFYVSSDGVTWQELLLPETPITSLQGVVFDAAGELYLLRGSRLFKRTL